MVHYEYCENCHLVLPHDQRVCGATRSVRDLIDELLKVADLPGLAASMVDNAVHYQLALVEELNQDNYKEVPSHA